MTPRQIGCPVEATIAVIGGKWKPLVVYHLLAGTRRVGELRRFVPEATQQMLTLQLRELERGGLVHREVYRQVPPKVEYSLTPRGRSLESILTQMNEWGLRYLGETERAVTASSSDDQLAGAPQPAPRPQPTERLRVGADVISTEAIRRRPRQERPLLPS